MTISQIIFDTLKAFDDGKLIEELHRAANVAFTGVLTLQGDLTLCKAGFYNIHEYLANIATTEPFHFYGLTAEEQALYLLFCAEALELQ